MPRIAATAAAASTALSALRMPPDLPRLPVGTCALTTQGPIEPNADLASSCVPQSSPRGTGTPAGASTIALAAYSSKFITHPCCSAAVFFPVRPEQFLFARSVLRDHGDEVSDVEEMLVAEIFGNAVFLPRAT